MRRMLVCISIALGGTLLQSIALGEILSLYPVSDRSGEDRPNVNTGNVYDGLFDTLFDDSLPDLETFHSQGRWEVRAALEFDVRLLPREARIVSATLGLQATGLAVAESVPTRLLVDGYSSDGIVGLSDLSASNRIGFAELPTPGQLPRLTVDATTFISSLHEVGGEYAGFLLGTVPGATVHVASNEWFQPHSRPRLDIVYENVVVPEPSTLTIVTAAFTFLILLFLLRRFERGSSKFPLRALRLGVSYCGDAKRVSRKAAKTPRKAWRYGRGPQILDKARHSRLPGTCTSRGGKTHFGKTGDSDPSVPE
jgi:hypothetical protein